MTSRQLIRRMPIRPTACQAFLIAGSAILTLFASPLAAQDPRVIGGAAWFVEAGVGAVQPRIDGGANIQTSGTGAVPVLRIGRTLRPRLAATLSVAGGQVRDARTEVYERTSGPTRTDVYDYRMAMVAAGLEYLWPVGRASIMTGLEAGWARVDWRLASHVDPAGFPAPPSQRIADPEALARIGLRYPLSARLTASGVVQLTSSAGPFNGVWERALPEVGLRWHF